MPATRRKPGIDPEEIVLYALMATIGFIPVAIALFTRAAFGFDATVGLLMLGLGILGMLMQLLR